MNVDRLIFLHEEISKGHALIALSLKNEKKGKRVPDSEFTEYVDRINKANKEMNLMYATVKKAG